MDTVLEQRLELRAQIGKQYQFAYPVEFVSLADYSAHRGRMVTVIRQLREIEMDGDGGEYHLFEDNDTSVPLDYMYEVMAQDGWVGVAWASELEEP